MRGDSFTTPIYLNVGTKLNPKYYSLQNGDKVYFGLMEPNQAFENAVMKKVYDWSSPTDSSGNPLLTIYPQDTEKLLVGQYYYMIKLKTMDAFGMEAVRTIVPPTLFWLNGNNPTEDIYDPVDKPSVDNNGDDLFTGEVDNVIFEGGVIE